MKGKVNKNFLKHTSSVSTKQQQQEGIQRNFL